MKRRSGIEFKEFWVNIVKNLGQNDSIYFPFYPAEIFIFDFLNSEPSKFSNIIFKMFKQVAILLVCLIAFSATQSCSDSAV